MWLRENNFEHAVIAKCAHPMMLKGRSIFTIDSSDFKCGTFFYLFVLKLHGHTECKRVKFYSIEIMCNCIKRNVTLPFPFLPPFTMGMSSLKDQDLFLVLSHRKAVRNSQKLFPAKKNGRKLRYYPYT